MLHRGCRRLAGLRRYTTSMGMISVFLPGFVGSGSLSVIESTLGWSDGVQDALAQQVEVGATVHLPLDHFDAVDVAFHRA